MRVIESNNDGFDFERAYVREVDGSPVPVAVMGGVECNIETKPGALMDGLAFCQPVNVKVAQDWPMFVRIEMDGAERTILNMTADAQVVAAARRFWDLAQDTLPAPGTTLS